MELIENQTMDEERALYGSSDLLIRDCAIDGPADGESAIKECQNITAEHVYFNLRYPGWHVHGFQIKDSEMTDKCRAALWYSDHVEISNSKLHGIKVLRECSQVSIYKTDIVSPECCWFLHEVDLEDSSVESEYFMMRSSDLTLKNVNFKGKYSFQYVSNMLIEDSQLDTKDAFWHTDHVTVKNSVLKGEYLAWYSKNLTLENCTIIGTQPFCYCQDLTLINCKMEDADFCFERSTVQATITTNIISIKNPLAGSRIMVPGLDELIRDIPEGTGEVIVTEQE